MKRRGLPRASTAMLIFVLTPWRANARSPHLRFPLYWRPLHAARARVKSMIDIRDQGFPRALRKAASKTSFLPIAGGDKISQVVRRWQNFLAMAA
jgi:hypothetical protein